MKKIIAGLFAVAAFTFSAAAQDPTDQKKHGREQGFHKMHDGPMEKLNLTDAQKQQMKSINEDFRNRMQALHQNDNILVKDMKAQQKSLMDERNSKISSILTAEQRTQFEQFKKQHEGMDRMRGQRDGKFEGRDGRNMGSLKESLGLSDDQVSKIKAGNESFREKAKSIQQNQSLSADQKRSQFESLQKEREASLKSYLTADQISKLEQMKSKHGDFKKGDWKEKRKSADGKEKVKSKNI